MSLQLCGQVGGNTGGVKCAVAPDKIQTIAIWGGTLTPEEYATADLIKTTLVADSKLSKAHASKLFMLPLRQNAENKKEANVEQTFSNGVKLVAREGLPGYRFSFFTSQAQNRELRKFNNQVVTVILQDAKKNVWGTKDADDNFVGRQAILFFDGLMHPTDDNVAGVGYFDIFFLDSIENFDEAYFVAADFGFQSNLKALIDVQLYETADSVANVLNISGKVDVANLADPLDILEDYTDTLFSTAALFTATNMTTGASIAITSLADGVLTLNSVAYAALATGTKVKIAAVVPPTLDAANVVGIECIELIHTKPA